MSEASDTGRLFQEELSHDPFWMMIGCILVNRTKWRKVRKVFDELRAACQTPEGLLAVHPDVLARIIRCLGFQNRRARLLHRFARAWISNPPDSWTQILDMPGCGLYAAQSYQIFVQGQRPDDPVTDHKLNWYLERMT